jgi:zinc protease
MLVLSILLMQAFSLSAAELPMEKILPNGLKVILLENHKTPLVTFQVWYRVGSRNEQWGKTGLSHMLEHMMFKGTEKIGPGQFSRIVEENGGNENAFTSADYTAYFENIVADHIEVPIRLEADRMQSLLLREDEFKTERLVVMEERRLRTEDEAKALLSESVEATAFQVQPYHWPVIGWMEDIEGFTVKDLRKYYAAFYTPSNAFIVVIGDFNVKTLFPLIEKTFGTIKGEPAPSQASMREQPQKGERRIVVKKESQLGAIIKAYHVPTIMDNDSYSLDLIQSILSSGESSRLYRKLVREQQLALSVDADNHSMSKDPGLFTIFADFMPGKTADEVETALSAEIERLQKEPVGERELEKAKNQLEASLMFMRDSLFYQAMILAEYEIVTSWRDLDHYIPKIRKITNQDVMAAAKKYLIPDNCTTGILVPLPAREGKSIESGSAPQEHTIR